MRDGVIFLIIACLVIGAVHAEPKSKTTTEAVVYKLGTGTFVIPNAVSDPDVVDGIEQDECVDYYRTVEKKIRKAHQRIWILDKKFDTQQEEFNDTLNDFARELRKLKKQETDSKPDPTKTIGWVWARVFILGCCVGAGGVCSLFIIGKGLSYAVSRSAENMESHG